MIPIEFIVFSKKSKGKIAPIEFNDTVINPSSKAKYLGVILDKKLTFTRHVCNIKKHCNTDVALLYNLLNNKSGLSQKHKLLIYGVIMKPIMLYVAPVWGKTCDSNINKLKIIPNKVLRMMLSAERTVRTDWLRKRLDVPKILELVGDPGTFPLTFYIKRIETTYSHVFLSAKTESAGYRTPKNG